MLFIVAIRCSALPIWDNLEVNTTSHVYNTWVNYTCGEGYVLADKHGSQVTYCNSHGTWIPQLILCKRKAFYEYITFIHVKYVLSGLVAMISFSFTQYTICFTGSPCYSVGYYN